tara:strand:- start:212 stop:889 length:678 start_codon:yes stop_codon:yes gene_type:complete
MSDELRLGGPLYFCYSRKEISNASYEDKIKMLRFNNKQRSLALSHGKEIVEEKRKYDAAQKSRDEKLLKEAWEAGRIDALKEQKRVKAPHFVALGGSRRTPEEEEKARIRAENANAEEDIDFLVFGVSFFVVINLFILIGMEHSIRTILLIPISGLYAMSALFLKQFFTGNFGVAVFSILFWVAIIYAFTFKSMLISAAVISMFAIPHFFINLYIDKLIARKYFL